MRISLRRQLRILQVCSAASFVVAAFLVLTAFTRQITYDESNGQRTAALRVWDRSDQPLSDLIRGLNQANALPAGPERDAAVKAARAKAPPGPTRLFAGKTPDRAAQVGLADANGKPRLVLKVEADGTASIDFLDPDGKTVQRIPSK